MALILADRVMDTSVTAGTGSLAVSGSAPLGWRTFSSACAVNDTFYYTIIDPLTGQWETGDGTYSATNTVARTTVRASTSAGAKVPFIGNIKNIFIDAIGYYLGTLLSTSGGTLTGPLIGTTATFSGAITSTGSDIQTQGGVVTVNRIGDAASGSIRIITDTGFQSTYEFQTAGVARWLLRKNSTAETGSNAGSDFDISPRDDAGGPLGGSLYITRATGNVGIGANTPLLTPARLTVYGTGQTTPSVDTASLTGLNSTVYVRDTGNSLGNGGMVLFGASQGSFAAIKGLIFNGTTNTTGDLVISTRRLVADATLTETARFKIDGSTVLAGALTGTTATFSGAITPTTALIGYGTAVPFSTLNASNTPVVQVASTGFTGFSVQRYAAATGGPAVNMSHSRSTTLGAHSIVAASDFLGEVSFNGSDGTKFIEGASVVAQVDGAPAVDDMPTRLLFNVTPDGTAVPVERMRIDNAGGVGIGTAATAIGKLHVKGVGQSTPSIDTANTLGAALFVQDSTTGVVGAGGMVMFGAGGGVFGALKGHVLSNTTNTTGDLVLSTRRANADPTLTETVRFKADGGTILAGSIGVGTAYGLNVSVYLNKPMTGSTSTYSVRSIGTIQSDVTTSSVGYSNVFSTAAAAFTHTTAYHFLAEQGTIGAGSTLTTQVGFQAASSMIGATTNYGFYGGIPSGTGRWNLYMIGTADNYLGGSLGIGASPGGNVNLRLQKTMTGATNYYGIYNAGTVQSDVTVGGYYNYAAMSTAAAAFTLGSITGYRAEQGTFGAGSAVTNQYGFYAGASLVGATNNYGLVSLLPAGTGRWNIYASGTAANYFAGVTTLAGGIIYGGVTLANTVTGTGSMVLATSPTLTGLPQTARLGIGVAPNATATATLWTAGDLTFNGPNHGIMGNLYYDTAWKYNTNGTGGVVKLGQDATTPYIVLIAPNNAAGADAAATPTTLMAHNNSTGVFTVTPPTTVTGIFRASNNLTETAGTASAVKWYDNGAGAINGAGTSAGALDFRSVGLFNFYAGSPSPLLRAQITANHALALGPTIAPPAGGTQANGVNFSSTANFGLMYGTGVANKIMARGSLYMRADGFPQVNVDGTAAGWTSVGPSTLDGYLYGCKLAYAATTSITIAGGKIADSLNATLVINGATFTKLITVAWVAGSGGGGLATSVARTANTTYHVFGGYATGGLFDAFFDTSAAGLNKPAAFTSFRRIGSIRTDGVSNVVPFIQDNDWFGWTAMREDVSVNNPGTALVNRVISAPLGINCTAKTVWSLTNNHATTVAYGFIFDPASTVIVASNTPSLARVCAASSSTNNDTIVIDVRTDLLSQVSTQIGGLGDANVTLTGGTIGYFDDRDRSGP